MCRIIFNVFIHVIYQKPLKYGHLYIKDKYIGSQAVLNIEVSLYVLTDLLTMCFVDFDR